MTGQGFISRIMLLPSSDGLQPIDIQRIGRIVAIAGANGAGKSRILKRISNIMHRWEEVRRATQDFLSLAIDKVPERKLLDLAVEIEHRMDEYVWPSAYESVLLPVAMTIASDAPPFHPLQQASVASFQNYSKPSLTLEASQDCFWRIGNACRGFIAATSSALEPTVDRDTIIERYADLCRRVRVVLNTDLKIHGQDDFRLFGLPLDDTNLSHGQRRLLDIAVKSWASQYALADVKSSEKVPLVILMDEPENHLHPDALIAMVESILQLDEGIQLFVATHSLPLLAHIGTDSTWFVKQGTVVYGGSQVGDIVESLLGGERNVASLRGYLSEPANFAMRRFVSQCLHPPATVGPKGNDPQAAQLNAAAFPAEATELRLRILDWGAGQGRLLSELDSIERADVLSELIDYFAFDTDPSQQDACKAAIARVYGTSIGRYISSANELAALSYPMDVVVMCNVLHEIPPRGWPDIFNAVVRTLKSDGRLLVAEDLLLPDGEQAFDAGFALLPPEAIRALCGPNVRVHAHSDEKYRDRLVVYEIAARDAADVDAEAVIRCLTRLRDVSLAAVKQFKSSGTRNWKLGHRYAIASQSYLNATLALEEMASAHAVGPSSSLDQTGGKPNRV